MTTAKRRTEQRWEQIDKSKTPLLTLAELYITTCRTEGKTAKTLKGYTEKLMRFVVWLDGNLGQFSIDSTRGFIAHLQSKKKWQDHRYTPASSDVVSAQTIVNHVRGLKGFATWLAEEQYTEDNRLARLGLPKAPRKVIEVLAGRRWRRSSPAPTPTPPTAVGTSRF